MEGSIYYRVYIAYLGYDILGIANKLSEVVELIETSMEEVENARYLIVQHFNELNMDNPFGVISNPQELLELKMKASLEEQKEKLQEEVKDDVSGRIKLFH